MYFNWNILDSVAQCMVEDQLTSPRIASCNALKKTESMIGTKTVNGNQNCFNHI